MVDWNEKRLKHHDKSKKKRVCHLTKNGGSFSYLLYFAWENIWNPISIHFKENWDNMQPLTPFGSFFFLEMFLLYLSRCLCGCDVWVCVCSPRRRRVRLFTFRPFFSSRFRCINEFLLYAVFDLFVLLKIRQRYVTCTSGIWWILNRFKLVRFVVIYISLRVLFIITISFHNDDVARCLAVSFSLLLFRFCFLFALLCFALVSFFMCQQNEK